MVAATKDKERDLQFGCRIRLRREDLGLSIYGLARKLGLEYMQIARYETGVTSLRASMMPPLAEALEVPIDYFFSQDELAQEGKSLPPGVLSCAQKLSEIKDEDIRADLLAIIDGLGHRSGGAMPTEPWSAPTFDAGD